MADLFDRLFPADETENIPVHGFHAAIADYVAGETTRSQIVTVWELDTEAQADLDILLMAADGLINLDAKLRFVLELGAVMTLAELGLKYTSKSDFRTRLGL